MALKDRFDRANELSAYWYNCSTDLHGSAAALWVSREKDIEKEIIARAQLWRGFSMGAATPAVFRMLCGLSIELMLKAILVARRHAVPMHHDLNRLARLAKVEFTETEQGLLEILTAAIMWFGRYPTPKTRAQWDRVLELDDKHLRTPVKMGRLKGWKYNGALDWEGFNQLWGAAHAVYAEARESEIEE